MLRGLMQILNRNRFAAVAAVAIAAFGIAAAAWLPTSQAYGGPAQQGRPSMQWEEIHNVKIEVDGVDSGKTATLKSGPTEGITSDVLPQDFPRRAAMKFTEAFVEIKGRRFAVGYLGGSEGKVYYALKGKDAAQDLVVTSVSQDSSVVLSFRDETKPVRVSVDVGGNGSVAEEDDYAVIGLGNQPLHAKGEGSHGAFDASHGSKITFQVEKQIAQQINISATTGEVKQVKGDDKTDVQLWEYTAPEGGAADKLTVTARATTNAFEVKAKMIMPGETVGGGDTKPNGDIVPGTNIMFGDNALSGYLLQQGVTVANDNGYPSGSDRDFANPKDYNKATKKGPVSVINLSNGSKLSQADQHFYDIKGRHSSKGEWTESNPERISPEGKIPVVFDRSDRTNNTILIDMVTTRCTPGKQAWAPQLGGITVNGQAIPFYGFDYTLKNGGPNPGNSLESRVGEWVTLGGKAKGTKVRVASLGAWGHGDPNDSVSLVGWEFHHYVVELREITGPIDIKGIYFTTANPRVLNVGSYGVETDITRKTSDDNPNPKWERIAVGGSLQLKDMVGNSGNFDRSHVRIQPKQGYTLEGASAMTSTDGKVGSIKKMQELTQEGEQVGGKPSKRYLLWGPSDKDSKLGYRYFYTSGRLVTYDVSYDENGGTYDDKPTDNKLYSVEGLTEISVAPQKPRRVDADGTWGFEGYDLIQVTGKGETQIKSGIQPGQTIKLSDLSLPAHASAKQALKLKAKWKQPAAQGSMVKGVVKYELRSSGGTVDHTISKEVLLAKGTSYDFVKLPDSLQHEGNTYVLNEKDSSLSSGTAERDGQEIGKAVYSRYGNGVLKGSEHLRGTKVVKGDGAPGLTGGDFSFQITADQQDAPMPAGGSTVKNKAGGAFSFGDITFERTGTYTYRIREVKDGKPNYGYDEHELAVTVRVESPDKAGAALKVAVDPIEEDQRTFTNAYRKPAPKPATLRGSEMLKGTKKLTGKDAPQLTEGMFSFEMTAVTSGAPMPRQATVGNKADGTFSFGDITFKSPGVFEYLVRERVGDDKDITYDKTEHRIKVTVEEPRVHGQELTLKVEGANSFNFSNVYSKIPEFRPGTLSGSKYLSGRKVVTGPEAPALRGDDFTFEISSETPNAPLPASTTVKNASDGAYSFGDITFSEPGTFTYQIKEVQQGPDHYRFDTHVRTLVVKAEKAGTWGGPLAVSLERAEGSETFTNVYTKPAPKPVTLSGGEKLKGTKRLIGDGAPAVKANQFRFSIDPVTNGAPMPSVSEVANDKGGNFSFGDITFTEPGEYTYAVREVPGGDQEIAYDHSTYTVTAKVAEPDTHGGQLKLEVESAASFDFTNVYTKLPDYVPATLDGAEHLSGTKVLVGDGAPALQDGQFLFVVEPKTDGAPMPVRNTVSNSAAGAFAFGDIKFTEPGTYIYEVHEKNGGLPQYGYDDKVVTVTVEATEDVSVKNDPLKIKVTKSSDLAFENTYIRPSGTHLEIPTGSVKLLGKDAPKLKGGEFEFRLQSVSAPDGIDAPAPAGNVANGPDGTFSFGKLVFEAPGTYEYQVFQVPGNDDMVTYDAHVAKLTVEVVEPGPVGKNRKVAKASYGVRLEVVGSLDFENHYRDLDAGPGESGRPQPGNPGKPGDDSKPGNPGGPGGDTKPGAQVKPSEPSLIPATGDSVVPALVSAAIAAGVAAIAIGLFGRKKL